MSDTPRTALPLLAAAQAQKHVTHNEALLKLDALLFARLLDRDLTAPPSSPADGDTYLVKATATGAWTGQNGKLAYAVDGAWRFYAPFTGLAAYVVDETRLLVFDGTNWIDYAQILALQDVPLLGINTTADSTNKLAAKSAAILFDNIGNGVQTKLNKHATGDTASFLYQTNYSGRAEIGLTGDDNFHFKTSPDGSSWSDAMVLDSAGRVLLDGQTTPYAVTNNNATATPTLQLSGLGTDASILFARFATGAGPARFTFAKSRGTTRGSFTVTADNDIMGQFSFNAADGTAFKEGAWMRALVDGTPSSGSVAGKLAFGTTPTGATIPTDWLTIRQNGDIWVGSGNTTTPACKLDVDGAVRVKSYIVAALPSASGAGQMIYVSNESGGAVIAFSDGTNWRRVTDRAVVS
ncbi:MAG: DUF2793 domain-containing protein [Alphaproteobacteria bacterium]|nr:DUF2793 domain-containing protein [Alphaproteobacteria bacterium]MBV9420678.1 DUF2793 domain-containing protein [Alphaproteobacteria bacterium]